MSSRSRRRLVALRRARQLLDLSHALASSGAVDEVAQRVSEAVRELTGCDQATVLVPDPDGTFRVAGVAAEATARERLVERPALPAQRFSFDRLPGVTITTRQEADAELSVAMTALGIEAVAEAPVRDHELRAVLCAEWVQADAIGREAPITTVLAAIAELTTTALANVELLDAAQHRALHDALTGLPNQVLFADRAMHAVTRARRNGELLALGVLDLDRFKTINDSLGHRAGDHLLVEVADRLRDAVRGHDTVARMGGDEFTLLLPDLQPHGEAVVAERLLAAFEEPFVLDGHAIRISPSIGLASFPAHGDNPERLLRNADAAMYRAKENGRNTWATYASGMSERAYDRLTLEADLHEALARREFRVGFEPVALAEGGVIAGAGALIRWSHPAFGMLEAGEFLGISEEIGIVTTLDTWVLQRACLELARADATGASPAWIGVRLASRTLHHSGLLQAVTEALTTAGLTPDRLVVEVPELAVSNESGDLPPALAELRGLGVRVALADFGRTSAPLVALGELPVDVLKLDRSFLRGFAEAYADDEVPVLRSVVALAHELGLAVIADGVDTDAQLAVAARHGCDLVQGAAVGRAQPHVPAASIDDDVALDAGDDPAGPTPPVGG
jgi:diguanylate cyclase (GGDEF)-like protein